MQDAYWVLRDAHHAALLQEQGTAQLTEKSLPASQESRRLLSARLPANWHEHHGQGYNHAERALLFVVALRKLLWVSQVCGNKQTAGRTRSSCSSEKSCGVIAVQRWAGTSAMAFSAFLRHAGDLCTSCAATCKQHNISGRTLTQNFHASIQSFARHRVARLICHDDLRHLPLVRQSRQGSYLEDPQQSCDVVVWSTIGLTASLLKRYTVRLQERGEC